MLNKAKHHKVGTSFAHNSSYKIIILEEKQKMNERASTALINFSIRESPLVYSKNQNERTSNFKTLYLKLPSNSHLT